MKKENKKILDSNILLEQYIKNIIDESLKAAFIDPFVDVAKTFMYGIEDLSARGKALIKTIYQGVPTLFVPLLNADYKKIREEEKAEIDAVREKYSDVLERNNAAFYDTDLAPLAFIMNPQGVLAKKLLNKTPQAGLAVLKTLEVITNGNEKVVALKNNFIKMLGLDKKPIKPSKSSGHDAHVDNWGGYSSHYGGTGDNYNWTDGNIDYGSMNEAMPIQQNPQQDIWSQINVLVNDKNLFLQSSLVQQMTMDAMNIYVQHVSKFMQINSYEELIQKYGQFLGKLNIELEKNAKNINPEEMEKMKLSAVQQMKSLYKQFYINKIKNMAITSPLLVRAAGKAIAQINSMK